jgi:NTP pyrophosphatase (non-canonical NTP hydrolase)
MLKNEDTDQREKWGIQTHDIFQWLAFITEELGELSQAISEYYFREGNTKDIVKEATQTAALALKLAVMAKEQL